jgi:predicted O-methyltransferase YrrM
MSIEGTSTYAGMTDLPSTVAAAVKLAGDQGFENSCVPEQGRLLSVLARGWSGGRIGETGTGCGVGLAWMVDATGSDTSFVSIEIDEIRAAACADLFAARSNVRVLHGDWRELLPHGPFDLLVLDGGGKGKDLSVDTPIDPTAGWLTLGGTVVMDDFTPGPRESTVEDSARRYWLEHPAMRTTELRLSPTSSTLVGVRVH